ncbi:MerR family transcriptional regulator [Micromonospora sp. NPDC005652]|uniref:MerR family transcriptional regulator n=1 Tax=Micromonospora sp. NPDC005652 TaxID=3157046 RepID=UPI0033CDC9DB
MTGTQRSGEQSGAPDRKPRPRAPEIPGITYRVLDHWVKKGYLRPGLEFPHRPAGKGNRRVWSDEEIRVARDMARLRTAGFTVKRAAAIARLGTQAVQATLGGTPEARR